MKILDEVLFEPPEIGTRFYYPGLPNSGSTLIDKSPYGNNSTITGATWKFENGLWFLYFDGTDDYVDLGSAFQTEMRGSFSVIMWVRPTAGIPAATQVIYGNANTDSTDRFNLQITTDGKLFSIIESNNNQARAKTANVVFSAGQESWHQIVCLDDSVTKAAGANKIYFDGVEQTLDGTEDGDTTGVTFADWTSADNLVLGAQNAAGTVQNFFKGDITLPRLVNRLLNVFDIRKSFNQEKHLFNVW